MDGFYRRLLLVLSKAPKKTERNAARAPLGDDVVGLRGEQLDEVGAGQEEEDRGGGEAERLSRSRALPVRPGLPQQKAMGQKVKNPVILFRVVRWVVN